MDKNRSSLYKKHKSMKHIRKKTDTKRTISKKGSEFSSESEPLDKTKSKETLKLKVEKKKFKTKLTEKKKKLKPNPNQQIDLISPTNLVKNPELCSSNWKKMMQTIEKKKSKASRRIKPHRQIDKNLEDMTQEKKTEPAVWFDDVDDIYIETLKTKEKSAVSKKSATKNDPLVKQDSFKGTTKCVAMDCEMVGVGEDGKNSVLARVSIVNQFGQCLYDEYVKSREPVTDYRTHVSGITPECLEKGLQFEQVQKEVSAIIEGKILVGHALHNDLKVLYLSHPKKKIRDTLKYIPFRKLFSGRNPSLKKLSEQVLNVKVQEGEHSSVQDAQAAMRLYTMYRQRWEKELKDHTFRKPKSKSGSSNTETATS